ncbi:MAG: nuclear transport factor 2 family protein [Mycobacterium sp.]|nr:nuclear transport factor 2 family protein [Mycobacterium sp.]
MSKPRAIQGWLDFMAAGDPQVLHDVLDDEVTFHSPAMFTPQIGREKSAAYLLAAEKMLSSNNFRYVDEWHADGSAILHFTVEIDGIQIEGIDMIHWNDRDKITRFTVMIRPLKGLQTVIAAMGELLSR